ncbi:MAG: insulinase family protein [Firmicutes bacterium]|nr:insulinase family protein [Bacillota bacterium]
MRVVLPSGLRVIVDEVPSAKSVSVGVWVGAGSRHEPSDLHGVSHFIEHMLFKGTKGRSAKEIADTIESRGGQLNAVTTRECTCLDARVLGDDLEVALDVLSDMVSRPTFAPPDIEKEKRVVIEEIRSSEDVPEENVHELGVRAAWPENPIGRDTLGTVRGVRGLDRDAIIEAFRARYVAGNMAVVAAGNCSHESVISAVERWFQDVPRGRFLPAVVRPEVCARTLVQTRRTEQAHLCVVSPGADAGSPDSYALHLLAMILGGGSGSRLFQAVREDRGLAYSIYTYHLGYSDCGLLITYAGTSPSSAPELETGIFREYERVAERGPTARELSSAKMQARAALLMSLESVSARMDRLGKSEMTLGRPVTVDEALASVEGVTLALVTEVARRTLIPNRSSVAWIAPGAGKGGGRDGQTG